MRWSIRIGRFAGTEVKIHVTFILMLVLFAVFFYSHGGREAMVQNILLLLLLFLCVLLHEFGHALAARGYGIRTPDITLLPIGGVARLERMPEKPHQELVVALAGPAVNVVIALGLSIALMFGPPVDLSNPDTLVTDLTIQLLAVNVTLVLFNLLPAFPMDGGRVLRALLAIRLPYARATQIAATVGQGMAFVFGLIGIIAFNPFLLFIAFFVYVGASQEATLANMKQLSTGLPVESAMVTHLDVLREGDTLDRAIQALLSGSQVEFPVLDDTGAVSGILTRQDLIRALRDRGSTAAVSDVMQRDIPSVFAHTPFEEAFRLMQQCACPALPVVGRDGRLVGLITPENIGELMMIHSALGHGVDPAWRRRQMPT